MAVGPEIEVLRRDARIAVFLPFECWCWHPRIVAGPVSGFETARLAQPAGLSLDEIRNPQALRIAGCAGSDDEIGEGLQGIGHANYLLKLSTKMYGPRSTRTGVAESVVVPLPSAPSPFAPQQ